MRIEGVPLVVSPEVPDFHPAFELSPHVAVPDQFRAEFNAWALQFFGYSTRPLILSVRDLVTRQQQILMSPRTWRDLQERISK